MLLLPAILGGRLMPSEPRLPRRAGGAGRSSQWHGRLGGCKRPRVSQRQVKARQRQAAERRQAVAEEGRVGVVPEACTEQL